MLEVQNDTYNNLDESHHDIATEHGEGGHQIDISLLASCNGDYFVASEHIEASAQEGPTDATQDKVGNDFGLNDVEDNEHSSNPDA